MAEGWLRRLADGRVQALSAGSQPAGYVHPLAVKVMAEKGIDLSAHRSESIDAYLDDPPDVVISVCEQAARRCPVFPRPVRRLSWPFDDPADSIGTDDEKMIVFRRVRDEIKDRIQTYLNS